MIAVMWNDLNDGFLLFGVLVLGCVGGCLGFPSRLSAPVTLTLALSRRAGEGNPSSALPPLGSRVRGNDGGCLGDCAGGDHHAPHFPVPSPRPSPAVDGCFGGEGEERLRRSMRQGLFFSGFPRSRE